MLTWVVLLCAATVPVSESTGQDRARATDTTEPAVAARASHPQWPNLEAIHRAAWPASSDGTEKTTTPISPERQAGSSSGAIATHTDQQHQPTSLAGSLAEGKAMPLPPRKAKDAGSPTRRTQDSSRPVTTVVGSLAIVLAVFLGISWLARRAAPRGFANLPHDVFETLGRAPMPGRQQLQLIRLGSKLVLLCVSPTGTETLAEVTEPDEVTRLTELCRQQPAGAMGDAFRLVASRYGRPDASSMFSQRQADAPGTRDAGQGLENRYA